jgi:hypothetical protein
MSCFSYSFCSSFSVFKKDIRRTFCFFQMVTVLTLTFINKLIPKLKIFSFNFLRN